MQSVILLVLSVYVFVRPSVSHTAVLCQRRLNISLKLFHHSELQLLQFFTNNNEIVFYYV